MSSSSLKSAVAARRAVVRRIVKAVGVVGIAWCSAAVLPAQGGEKVAAGQGAYARWRHGPPGDAGFFPIAVWLQSPHNAPKYQALGVNLYIGLWNGPTEQQIAELARHGMPVICEQNKYALKHLDEKTIVGWMHGDEPDNAQSLGKGKGYGPPIPPATIAADYQRIKAEDPTRPVVLNLGQGVAWDGWHGRGVRTNHPEDYPEYVRGGDVLSFDIYPAVHDRPAVAGKLWYVAQGTDRLRRWTPPENPVWSCIECTRISNLKTKPTPAQVKAEVWMALIHGARGLIYFCHQFQPRFIEAGLLAEAEMCESIASINRQIHTLAAVINSPALDTVITVRCDPPAPSPDRATIFPTAPIAAIAKRHSGTLYLFTVSLEPKPVQATFQLPALPGKSTFEVLGEHRRNEALDGQFTDRFEPYGVHLYQVQPRSP